jgi:hypothetical protein
MKYILHATGFGLICLLVLIFSCKKSTSNFNLSTPGLTATLNGQTAQYLVPAGLVNYSTLSGYEKTATSNTIILTIDSSVSAVDTFGRGSNSLVILNNGVQYSSANNHGAFAGIANVAINGSNVTGTFSGVLYNGSSFLSKDSMVVTNGTISSTY